MMAWWRRVLRRERMERQLDAELRDHLDRQVADYIAAGLAPAEARRRARQQFGGVDQIKEQCRDARGTRWLDELSQDVRYSLRVLRRSPVFTLTVVCSLALGIGGVTSLFSVFNALALTPLPVPRPDQIVTLAAGPPEHRNPSFPYPTFDHLRRQTRTLTGLFAFTTFSRINVGTADGSEMASNAMVSGDYFRTLDLQAGQGRLLTMEDDQPSVQVVVLSDRYWRARFGGDPSIVGRTIALNALPFTVVGVTPPGFAGANIGTSPDLFIPLRTRDRLVPEEPWWDKPYTWLELTGRLRDGVTIEQAQAELDGLFQQLQQARLAAAAPADRSRIANEVSRSRLRLISAAEGVDSSDLRARLSRALEVLLAIAGGLLLIASLNIANLLLARSAARRREMAVRLAIGAGRGRLVRQLLTETLLLTALGAAGGLALALWAGPLIVRMQFPHAAAGAAPLSPVLDARVLAFTCLLALLTALLFGIVPALRATRTAPAGTLQARAAAGHAPRARLDATLVVAQIALSVVLLAWAALFARSLHSLGARDGGYDRANVLMFAVNPYVAGFAGADVTRTYDALRERLGALPGVVSTTISVVRPVDEAFYFMAGVDGIDGRLFGPEHTMSVASNIVGPRFFETYRIPLRAGREFSDADRRGAPPVAIVSEALARTLSPDRSALGRRLDLTGPDGLQSHEIVGIVADIRYVNIKEAPRGVLYVPAHQGRLDKAWFPLTYALRTAQPAATLIDPARRAVREISPSLPLDRVMTLAAQTDASLARERLLASLSGYFGGLALLLVSLGLYGLMAYLVIQRTAEIGVRLALGATRGSVRALVLGRAGRLVALGLLLGLPAAFATARLAGALIYDVTPRDPESFIAASALVAGGALLAVWLPARRAARVDPCVALRAD